MNNSFGKITMENSELTTTSCHFSEYFTPVADGGSDVNYVDTRASSNLVTSSSSSSSSSSSECFSAHDDDMVESGLTELEREIEASKVHWSERTSMSSFDSHDDDGERKSNRDIYDELRKEPKYQQWLNIYGVQSSKDIVFGPKIAEGGQAEIYEADDCAKTLGSHFSYVLKVYKKGFSLKDLKTQWPDGVLSSHKYIVTGVQGGMVLDDDRFAFVLKRCHIDLRKIIEVAQEWNSPLWKENARPLKELRGYSPRRGRRNLPVFSESCAKSIMLKIACDMRSLHDINVLHRDLKASNILCNDFDQTGPTRRITVHLADYESSIGVSGTEFWRAPEILQQVKEGKSRISSTKQADVYAYAMTCYEILTGCIPFDGCKGNDYEKVLKGARPVLPDYVPGWIKDLLGRCWHQNPQERPDFLAIKEEIKAHGTQIQTVVLEAPPKAHTSWISKDLLGRCWHKNPQERPDLLAIKGEIKAHGTQIQTVVLEAPPKAHTSWISKDLLGRCWHENPQERPDLLAIKGEIKAHGTQIQTVVLEAPPKAHTSWISKDLLGRCWHENPQERPDLLAIKGEIKAHGTQIQTVVLEAPPKAHTSWISKGFNMQAFNKDFLELSAPFVDLSPKDSSPTKVLKAQLKNFEARFKASKAKFVASKAEQDERYEELREMTVGHHGLLRASMKLEIAIVAREVL